MSEKNRQLVVEYIRIVTGNWDNETVMFIVANDGIKPFPKERFLFKGGEGWVPLQEGALMEPSLALSKKVAQELIDSLFMAGIRPTEWVNHDEMNAHLQDMRKIVFHKLGIK